MEKCGKVLLLAKNFSTSILIGCNYVNNAAALTRCLILWKSLCACRLPYPKAIKNNFSSLPIYMFREFEPQQAKLALTVCLLGYFLKTFHPFLAASFKWTHKHQASKASIHLSNSLHFMFYYHSTKIPDICQNYILSKIDMVTIKITPFNFCHETLI